MHLIYMIYSYVLYYYFVIFFLYIFRSDSELMAPLLSNRDRLVIKVRPLCMLTTNSAHTKKLCTFST